MPRSLVNGDYSLVMAVESSSRADSWYRVLADRQTGALSCDCPPWTFKQDAQASTSGRSCHHTRLAQQLSRAIPLSATTPAGAFAQGRALASLISATQQQWPGLRGEGSIEGRGAEINEKPYMFFLLTLAMGNGGMATGVTAFAQRHRPTQQHLQTRVAMWSGYAIASEVARIGGFPLAGQPPEHFRVTSGRRARRAVAGPASTPAIGLGDILRIGDVEDLGDGLRPTERAELTLRLFLGEQLYQQLETRGFLDVSSAHYAEEQRVYRLRRDPSKRYERRVRVFERGRYFNDLCIVRAQNVPEADHFLTVFLGLLSDEETTLSVVKRHNIFAPNSDGRERETVPAIWQPRLCIAPPKILPDDVLNWQSGNPGCPRCWLHLRAELLREMSNCVQVEGIDESEHQLLHARFLQRCDPLADGCGTANQPTTAEGSHRLR